MFFISKILAVSARYPSGNEMTLIDLWQITTFTLLNDAFISHKYSHVSICSLPTFKGYTFNQRVKYTKKCNQGQNAKLTN